MKVGSMSDMEKFETAFVVALGDDVLWVHCLGLISSGCMGCEVLEALKEGRKRRRCFLLLLVIWTNRLKNGK